uniref:DUF148 domain-containing protein n=1 Tax=Steinernema glaseri TaxID=37863 RepID=A0A1I8ABD5_9BILA
MTMWSIFLFVAFIGVGLGDDTVLPAYNISSQDNLARNYELGETVHLPPNNAANFSNNTSMNGYIVGGAQVETATPYLDDKSKLAEWRQSIKDFGSKLKGWWHTAKDKMKEKYQTFKGQLSDATHSVKDYFHNVTEPFRDGWRDFKTDMDQKGEKHEQEFEQLKQTLLASSTQKTK